MSSDYYGAEGFGSSPFDDFIARIYGTGHGPLRPGQRVDITRLMSAPARELIGTAAAQAGESGGGNLDTEHLLWAAATLEPTGTLLGQARTLLRWPAGLRESAVAKAVVASSRTPRSPRN